MYIAIRYIINKQPLVEKRQLDMFSSVSTLLFLRPSVICFTPLSLITLSEISRHWSLTFLSTIFLMSSTPSSDKQ